MRNTFNAVITVALLTVSVSACQKATFTYGDDVRFRASTGAISTKADYSGEYAGNIERINWENGDKVRIACAQVSEPSEKYADYLIENVSADGRYSLADIKLSSSDNAIGLRWGTGTHSFYAVYPSPLVSGVTKSQQGNIVTGQIPATQAIESMSGTAASKVAKPVFEASMMMAASTSVSPDDDPLDVSLDFVPVTTAIQFTITNKTRGPLTTRKVELESETHPLIGPFSYDISTGKSTFTGTLDEDSRKALIKFDEDIITPVDGTLTFTFFLNPAYDVDDLMLYIYETDKHARFTDFRTSDGTAMTFKSGLKYLVGGIFVPDKAIWKVSLTGSLLSWTVGEVENIEL